MSASQIHPTAIVDPKAELGQRVKVGPGAIIDAGCVIGDDSEIRARAIITGTTKIGAKNQIGYGAIIGAEPQDAAFKNVPSRVVIGNNNVIREYVTIHRGTKENSETVIGNDNFLMVGVHLAHNCRLGNNVTLVNNVLLAGYVEVHDRAFIGGAAVVHQHCRVGELVMIKGLGRINRDVPPYFLAVEESFAAGLNSVGLKRAGISPEARKQIREAFDLLYHSGHNVTQAVEKIEKNLKGPEIKKLVEFIRSSKRGICFGTSSHVTETESED
jgi:UDP-N-acetylglucosamine acyltransferase